MINNEWKYWLSAGVISAFIAVSIQTVFVLSQESPGFTYSLSFSYIVMLPILGVSVCMPMAYVQYTKGRGETLGAGLIIVGLALVAIVLRFSSNIIDFFFPRTLVIYLLGFDFMFTALAGWMLVVLQRISSKERQSKVDSSPSVE